MKKLNNVFSEIKTPESWKENLYERIQEEENMTMKNLLVKPLSRKNSYQVAMVLMVLWLKLLTVRLNNQTICLKSL